MWKVAADIGDWQTPGPVSFLLIWNVSRYQPSQHGVVRHSKRRLLRRRHTPRLGEKLSWCSALHSRHQARRGYPKSNCGVELREGFILSLCGEDVAKHHSTCERKCPLAVQGNDSDHLPQQEFDITTFFPSFSHLFWRVAECSRSMMAIYFCVVLW